MEQTVQEDITIILRKALTALQQNKIEDLLELSNHTIHDASIFQDEDSISFAVLLYALYKTLMRCKEAACPIRQFLNPLQQAQEAILAGNIQQYKKHVKLLLSEIKKTDKKLSLYIEEVLDKARIKKGSKIHEHGISIARTAEMLGISHWELAHYIGKTTIPSEVGRSAHERLALARKLFS